ncbi:MAG: hypothetical protein HFJ48_02085 [Clostridia bacterium]|nr:hypothetical protein [Clostridia bacterium]
MAIQKRTQKEIEKDCKRLKEAAKTATTMKELENLTGLSYVMINTTLSKHPIMFKRIKEQLAVNKKRAEEKQKELEVKAKAEEKAKKDAMVKETKQSEIVTTNKNNDVSGFVIDASITGIENLREYLSKICSTQTKLILTSITIKELEKMQKFKDIDGNDARFILNLAVEKYNSFETVLIDETLDTPDDCIIKYCADHKESVTLLTSDKTMALRARMYSVQVHYFKQPTLTVNSNTLSTNNSKIMTLLSAKRIGNKLLISNFQTDTRSICVYSEGIEYNDGVRELKVGDDVFISSKKPDYITFAHYRIISLYAENNCELIYSKRFYDNNDIDVPKPAYTSFIKDFKLRHNL